MAYYFKGKTHMIKSFKCKDTMDLMATGKSRRFQTFERIALRKLDMLDAVETLETLQYHQAIISKPCMEIAKDNTALE